MAKVLDLNEIQDAEQMRREIEELQNLLKSRGWALFAGLVQQHMNGYTEALLAMQAQGRDWLAGYLKGLDQAISLPSHVLKEYDSMQQAPEAPPDNPVAPLSPYPEEQSDD